MGKHRPGLGDPTHSRKEDRIPKLTILAANEELTIVLVEPELAEMPRGVVVHWPAAPTVSEPAAFSELARGVVKLFATAATKLAGIKAMRRL